MSLLAFSVIFKFQLIDFPLLTPFVRLLELRALIWNQKSWLLKIIAIEVRLCTANQQRSYISKLLKSLFGGKQSFLI